ncbi:MAG: hypothetical protein L7S67_05055, partial [Flavobacteriales bacterium]|nr:hypothetical protein [Flavobacteriales bacterium]
MLPKSLPDGHFQWPKPTSVDLSVFDHTRKTPPFFGGAAVSFFIRTLHLQPLFAQRIPSLLRCFCLLALIGLSVPLASSLSAQTTIYSEDFSSDSGTSTSTLVGGTWSATQTGGNGNMSITSASFRRNGGNQNNNSCTWTSDPLT